MFLEYDTMLKLHEKLRNNDLYYYNIDYYYNFISGDKTSFLIRLYDNNDNYIMMIILIIIYTNC